MKLAVAAMVRNEIDIVGTFLRHLDAMFDDVLLMDHGSLDGTDRVIEAACAQRPGWTMWRLDAVSYNQTLFSTFALRHLMQHTDADFLMLLDADEFIDTLDRASFEAALARIPVADRVGVLLWLNAMPCRFDTRTIEPGEAIWAPRKPSELGKVVIPRAFLERHGHEVQLGDGNHALAYDAQHVVPAVPAGRLLHLPIRAHAQIRTKVLAGVFAVMMQTHHAPEQCWHWHDILDRMGEGTLTDADLIGMAAQYSRPGGQGRNPAAWADLPEQGFLRRGLNVAFGDPSPPVAGPLALDPVRLVASIVRRFRMEDATASALVLEGNRLRFAPRPADPSAPAANGG